MVDNTSRDAVTRQHYTVRPFTLISQRLANSAIFDAVDESDFPRGRIPLLRFYLVGYGASSTQCVRLLHPLLRTF